MLTVLRSSGWRRWHAQPALPPLPPSATCPPLLGLVQPPRADALHHAVGCAALRQAFRCNATTTWCHVRKHPSTCLVRSSGTA